MARNYSDRWRKMSNSIETFLQNWGVPLSIPVFLIALFGFPWVVAQFDNPWAFWPILVGYFAMIAVIIDLVQGHTKPAGALRSLFFYVSTMVWEMGTILLVVMPIVILAFVLGPMMILTTFVTGAIAILGLLQGPLGIDLGLSHDFDSWKMIGIMAGACLGSATIFALTLNSPLAKWFE